MGKAAANHTPRIDFVKKHDDCLHEVVNLDCIPGKYGRVPSAEEVEDSALQGWDNLMELDRAGIDAIPVYHQGERRYWLEKMIAEGYDYIGISPANDRTTSQKQKWLDEVFHYLCGENGFPEIRPHGFGFTALPLLRRYPWYSVDSSIWLKLGAHGDITVPRWGRQRDQYDYTTSPEYIRVSERDEGKGQHLSSLTPTQRTYVLEYLDAERFDLEQLKRDHYYRMRANCRFFKRVMENYTPQPFRYDPSPLLEVATRRGSPECGWDSLRIVFGLTTDPGQSDVLADEGVKNRLLSYFNFKGGEQSWFDVREYVKVGRFRNPNSRAVVGFPLLDSA